MLCLLVLGKYAFVDVKVFLPYIHNGADKYVKYAAQKVMKDNLINVCQSKEDKLNGQIEKHKNYLKVSQGNPKIGKEFLF